MKRTYEALKKSHNKYKGYIEKLEEKLSGKVEFEFFIQYLEAEGHCIVNANTTAAATLEQCIEQIDADDYLSEKWHSLNCIQ